MRAFDLVIVGGGPAGLAAGIQAGHMGLSVVIMERSAGVADWFWHEKSRTFPVYRNLSAGAG